MATTQPKSGITELTSTANAGPLTLTGAKAGFRGFVSADDGKVYHYGIFQSGTAFEAGVGTYTHASRQLSRTTVLANILGTTSPLTLGGGTKEVSIILPGERTAMLDCIGEWSADQHFNGQRLYLDSAQTSWIDMTSAGFYRLYIASVLVWESSGNLGNFTLIGSNDTATEGPEITLRRDSATPAANDALGVIRMQGKDSAGVTQTTFKMRGSWLSPAVGSFSSIVDFSIVKSGAVQQIFTMRPDALVIPAGSALYTAGKTATNVGQVGAEMTETGEVVAVCNGGAPMYAYRNGSDGTILQCGKNGVSLGGIILAAGDFTLTPFTGSHLSEWATGEGGAEFEEYGTVVSTADGKLGILKEPAPLVRPACGPDDRRVYGVVAARQLTEIGGPERSVLVIHAVGDGFIKVKGDVAGGDLLRASLTPGVAEAIPKDTPATVGTMACAVAKATQPSADDGAVRLVECVFMGG